MGNRKVGSDLEIAQGARLKHINEIAAVLGIDPDDLEHYGKYKAKMPLSLIDAEQLEKNKLILVTAITPTPPGEGKTTVSIGLSEGMNRIGRKTTVVLREPSLGPVFGIKGGATGGGYSQVVPMEDINLHFTGDFSAIEKANNLLAALIDNNIFLPKGSLGIDPAHGGLEARHGHERPFAAHDRHRARRPHRRQCSRGGLQHHGRLGNHGHPVPGRIHR